MRHRLRYACCVLGSLFLLAACQSNGDDGDARPDGQGRARVVTDMRGVAVHVPSPLTRVATSDRRQTSAGQGWRP